MVSVTKIAVGRLYLKPAHVPNSLVSVLIALTLLIAIYCGFVTKQLPDFSAYTTVLLLLLSLIISIWITPKNFTVGFLTSLLPYMIGWRIGAMLNITIIMTVAPFAFAAFVGQFIDCVHNDWVHEETDGWLGNMQWQMTLVRLYFGFNWTGHFTEKLFAGTGSFNHLVQVFYNYCLTSHTAFFVIIGVLFDAPRRKGLG